MRWLAALVSAISLSACAHMPWSRHERETGIESVYWRAVTQLDTATTIGSLESARALLDGYLSATQKRKNVPEARVLRRLAESSIQLTRVEASLRATARSAEARAESTDTKRPDAEPKRDEEAVKEIQRLKDELAKANAELERIRKRLANPKEPSS